MESNTNKQWEIIVKEVSKDVFEHFEQILSLVEFGAYIEPQNYFVSYIFGTDKELAEAMENGLTDKINDYHKTSLTKHGYPVEGVMDCTFASQEECDRTFNGNWYYYYH